MGLAITAVPGLGWGILMANGNARAGRCRLLAPILALALAQMPAISVASPGADLYKNRGCHACHGEPAGRPLMPIYPRLAGQSAEYLYQQMRDIRDGARANGLSAAMRATVSTVTDAEFKAIAVWLADQ